METISGQDSVLERENERLRARIAELEERLHQVRPGPAFSTPAGLAGDAAQEALRQQQEWLRVTLTSIGDAVLAADPAARVTFLNPVAAKLTGWAPQEALGRPIREVFRIINEETRKEAEDIVASVLRLGCIVSLANRTVLVTRDGREIPIEDSAAPIRDTEGKVTGVVLVFRDVTEKRHAQEALRESEQRVRRKLDSILSPAGDIGALELGDIVDAPAVQSLMEDFYRLAGMPMAIIGLKGEVVVGVGWQDICTRFHRVHPESCEHCIQSDTELSAGVPPGECRLYKCKNNMWDMASPIMVGGRHVGNVFTGQFFFEDEPPDEELFRSQARYYGFPEAEYLAALERVPRLSREAVDRGMAFLIKLGHLLSLLSYSNIKLARSLSERDALTASLERSGELLNRAQEIAHLGSWDLDLTLNRLSWSDEVYRIFGLQPQEFGATYEAFLAAVHPEDRAAVDAAYSGSLRENTDAYEVVHRVVRRDTGETRWVQEKCSHVRDAAGAIMRSVGMVQDITDRRRAQEAIEEARREAERHLTQLEVIVDHLAEGLVVSDLDGNVFHWNPAAVAMHGFSSMEEGRRRLPEFTATFELSTAEEGILPLQRWPLARILRGETLRGWEVQVRRRDKEWQRIFSYGGTLARQPDGTPLLAVVTVTDITERKQAEQAVRQSEGLLRAVCENTADCIVLKDREARIVLANPATLHALGKPAQEVIGRTDAELFSDQAIAGAILETDRRVMEGGQTEILEETTETSQGRRVYLSTKTPWRNGQGEVIGLAAVARDITERKKSEEELRKALAEAEAGRRLLDALMEHIPLGITIAGSPDLSVQRVSKYGQRLLDQAGEDAADQRAGRWQLCHPDGLTPAAAHELPLTRATEHGEVVQGEEWIVVRKDGARIPILCTAAPILDKEGRITGGVTGWQDITERKRTEQALRDAQKLESIGVLAGGIAHDFNNLLTCVLGNASLLMLEPPPGSIEQLKSIMDAGEKAAYLTRQLLAYAGKGQFQITDADVSRLVLSSADLIRLSVPKNIELVLDAPGNLPRVRCDPTQIQQVVMNLAINAAEAIGDSGSGKVFIGVGACDLDAASLARLGFGLVPGRYISITVRDNGCGMDEDMQARIFDPFFTTKFTGRGLGLAAVQGILRSQKGGITVESRPGQGSTFVVYLPAVAAPAAARHPETPDAGHGRTVLVVDDEEGVRVFTKAALERLGHRVLLAANGKQAIDVLCANPGVDLVLLDIVMPVAGGAEAFEEIRRRWPTLAVLVASGFNRDEARRFGIPAGLPFIEKPYTLQRLSAAIEKVLGDRG